MRGLPSSAGYGAFKSKKQENTIKLCTLLDSAILLASAVPHNALKKPYKHDTFVNSATLFAPGVQNNKTYEKTQKTQ